MSLSDKINMLVAPYVRRQAPNLNPDFLSNYLQEELRELEASIRSLVDASIQVANTAPESPRKGMVRYAVSPWDPLSNSFSGLVVYSGTAWVSAGGTLSTAGLVYDDF
tara:strand:+ start:738 stop:1061 length:324 start_codon:yes stop_codon:yes gene_type:complete